MMFSGPSRVQSSQLYMAVSFISLAIRTYLFYLNVFLCM